LAPYAMRDEDTQGRRFAERPHLYRSEYQRDRDRVIHTKAFRRLEKKTQVFAPDYSDHFRNRLTHTIEVAQISRTISRTLGLNTDLCEVLALSHDIGHPPYSHEGERVLDRIMKGYGEGFEHNLHALRIVEDFEEKYAAFRGLNLTFEVREGIVKHSRDYGPGDEPYIDISAYRLGSRPPLEAQLIDSADEIAYNAADLDDGYDSGLLSVGQMNANLTLFRQLWGEVQSEHIEAEEKLKVSEVVRRIIDFLVTNLIAETRRTIDAYGINSVEQVRRFEGRLFKFDSETASHNGELKGFLRRYLYDHEVLRRARRSAERQLEDLFEYYLRKPENLPPSHNTRVVELGLNRVVCDYIAGMTDTFARSTHREIFGAAESSS
ncbi:MAG TPA: deoxyguanosinetriphosphate triphosphohydrolase, partial [Acidobacteriota bacterium]|nr:deoxyguanosinetriphosphate triphosphohydrolase [Acidobacteriota bacterium]